MDFKISKSNISQKLKTILISPERGQQQRRMETAKESSQWWSIGKLLHICNVELLVIAQHDMLFCRDLTQNKCCRNLRRRCPHSRVGKDFWRIKRVPLTKTGITRKQNGSHMKKGIFRKKSGFWGQKSGFWGQKNLTYYAILQPCSSHPGLDALRSTGSSKETVNCNFSLTDIIFFRNGI